MNKFELYEKAYYFELDRMDKINSRISIPLGILTLMSGALLGIINKYFKLPNKEWTGYFKVVFFIEIVLFIYCIYLTVRSYHGYKYAYIPVLNEIEQYESSLVVYKNSINAEDNYVENKLEEYYIDIFKKSRDNNSILNEKKLQYQLRLGICISCQIPLIGILYILLIYFKI